MPNGEEMYLWHEDGFTPKSQDYDRPEWSSQIWAHQTGKHASSQRRE